MSTELIEPVDEQHLQRYANLSSNNVSIAEQTNAVEPQQETVETSEEPVEEEVIFQTKKTKLWMLPLPKLLLVSGVVAVVLITIYLVTSGLVNVRSPKPAVPIQAPKPVTTSKKTDPQTQPATLQTEVALGRSGVELDRLNAKKKDARSTTNDATKGKTAQSGTVASSSPPPPAPVRTERLSSNYPSPSGSSISQSPPRQVAAANPIEQQHEIYRSSPNSTSPRNNLLVSTPANSHATLITPSVTSSENVVQKWQALANIGSFGSGQTGSSAGLKSANSTNEPSGGTGTPPFQSQYQPAVYRVRPDDQATVAQSSVQLPSGTKAVGRLSTPIAWSGSAVSSRQALPKLRIKLTQPLGAINAGSTIIATITSADNSGLLQLVATALVQPDGQTSSLSPDQISFFAEGGKPLQAHYHGPKSGGGSGGLLSQLGNAAGLFGGSSNLSRLSALSQFQAHSNLQSQSQYFTLNQGTVIVLYVN